MTYNSKDIILLLDFETNTNNRGDVLEVSARKVLLLDEATNGKKQKNSIALLRILKKIEFGPFNGLYDQYFKEIDHFHRFYFSKHPTNYFAYEVHQLDDEKISNFRGDAKYPKYFLKDKDFIKYVDNVETLIAHNISFELRHLPKSIKFKNHLCTMKANTRILNLKKTNGHLKPPKLTETCEFYAIKPDSRKIHTASYDTYLLLRILKKMEFESLSDLYVEELERKNKSNIVKPKLRKSKSRESCPKCSSSNTIKRGFKVYKTGKSLQRYSCNSCRHTFTPNSISTTTCRNTTIDTPSFEYNQQTKDLIRSIGVTHERNEDLNTLKSGNRTPKKDEPAYSNYDIQVIKPPSGALRKLPKKFIFKQKTHSIYDSLYIINYRPAIFRKIMFFLTPSAFQRFARFLYYMVFILMTGDTQ